MLEEAVTSSKRIDLKKKKLVSLTSSCTLTPLCVAHGKTLPGFYLFQFQHSLNMKLSLLVSTVIPVCLYSSGKTEIF